MQPSFLYEKTLWKNGVEYVIGIDEVGRGAFAGPLVLAAVLFPKLFASFPSCLTPTESKEFSKITDSKLLSPKMRKQLVPLIQEHSIYSEIIEVPVSIINRIGIGRATYTGVRKLVRSIRTRFNSESCHLLMDGFTIPYVHGLAKNGQRAIIHGDRLSYSIAAASILAKVYRDTLMEGLSIVFPHYHFAENKGYGTAAHIASLRKNGTTPLHRKSFDLRAYLTEQA